MKKSYLWINTASLVLICAGCSISIPASITIQENDQRQERKAAVSPANGSAAATESKGMVVHIDPTTGRFIPEMPGGVTLPSPADAARASVPELFETTSPVAGGGVMVDLNGQFETPLAASVDADGKITLKHEAADHSGTGI